MSSSIPLSFLCHAQDHTMSMLKGFLKVLGNNHKNIINRVQELPISITVTRNLMVHESLSKGASCAWRRLIAPSIPYLR